VLGSVWLGQDTLRWVTLRKKWTIDHLATLGVEFPPSCRVIPKPFAFPEPSVGVGTIGVATLNVDHRTSCMASQDSSSLHSESWIGVGKIGVSTRGVFSGVVYACRGFWSPCPESWVGVWRSGVAIHGVGQPPSCGMASWGSSLYSVSCVGVETLGVGQPPSSHMASRSSSSLCSDWAGVGRKGVSTLGVIHVASCRMALRGSSLLHSVPGVGVEIRRRDARCQSAIVVSYGSGGCFSLFFRNPVSASR
jgi:hypothetical protein